MNAAAVAGVSDPQLRALLHDHWEGMLARYPEWATRLGDRRFDHRLTDRSRAGQQAWDEHVRGWLARGRSLDPADDEDRVTLALLVEQLEVELEVSSCRYREWAVSARDNPLTWASWLTGTVPLDGLEGLEARYRTLPATFQAAGADLRTGLADGLVASAESLRRVVAMLDRQLALPLEGWPLVTELPDEVEAAWR
ncbi:MAG: DUF885 domain-containing protein, partial [Proteobacteria bacterium]|nr:DUF885 domain-containing protein [Pseudomonadota bacterium]